MRQSLRVLFVAAFCLLLVGSVGCTRSRKSRVRATGTVTAAGRPVKYGQITFTKVGGGRGFTEIVHDGRFTVRNRYPMTAGQYDVTIKRSSRTDGLGADRHSTQRVTVAPLVPRHFQFDVP